MAAPQILVLLVEVRVLVGQPIGTGDRMGEICGLALRNTALGRPRGSPSPSPPKQKHWLTIFRRLPPPLNKEDSQ